MAYDPAEYTKGFVNTGLARSPYYGRPDLMKQSAVEAWNFSLTKSAVDFARYWAAGDDNQLTRDIFNELIKEDELEGWFDWPEEGLSVDQYMLASGWAKDRKKRIERIQASSRSMTDKAAGLVASFGGSMADPIELLAIGVPALRVETWALRAGMARKMGMTVREMSAMARQTPKAFAQRAAEMGMLPVQGSGLQAFKRGAVLNTAEALAREPFIYGFNTAAQKDYRFSDSMINVGASGLLGGFFHGAVNRAARLRFGELMEVAIEGHQNRLPAADIELINKFNTRYAQFNELWEKTERVYGGRSIPEKRWWVDNFLSRETEGKGPRTEFIEELDELYLRKGEEAARERVDTIIRQAEEGIESEEKATGAKAWLDNTINNRADADEVYLDSVTGRDIHKRRLEEELADDMLLEGKKRTFYHGGPEGIKEPHLDFSGDGLGNTWGYGFYVTTLREYAEDVALITKEKGGAAYRIDIDPSVEEHTLLKLLDVFEDQPMNIREQLVKLLDDESLNLKPEQKQRIKEFYKNRSASTIYDALTSLTGTPKAASELLLKYGIEGATYPAVRKRGEKVTFGDVNLVLYNPKKVVGLQEMAKKMHLQPNHVPNPYHGDLFGHRNLARFPDPEGGYYWRRIDQEDLTLIANVDDDGNIVGINRLNPEEVIRPRTRQETIINKYNFAQLYDRSRPARRVPLTKPAKRGKVTKPIRQRVTEEQILADMYHSVFGVEVRFLDIPQAKELGIAGRVMSRHAGVLFVVAGDLPTMSFISGHEFFHSVKWQNPELFMRLIDTLNKYDTDGSLLRKAFDDYRARLSDKDLSKLTIGKQYEEAYANIFGEVASRKDYWDFLKTRVPEGEWQQFKQMFSEFVDRLIRYVEETLDYFGIKDTRKVFMGTKERNELLRSIGDPKVRKMVKEITDLLKDYDANEKHPWRSLVGDKALDERISQILEQKGTRLARRAGLFKQAHTRFLTKLEDEVDIVNAEQGSEALESLLAGDPLPGLGSVRVNKPIKNIRQYALAIPSQKNPKYRRLYNEWQVLSAREYEYQNFVGPQIKALRKKVKELGTRVRKAYDAGDKARHARLVDSYRQESTNLKQLSKLYGQSKRLLNKRMEEIEGVMGILVIDEGEHYMVYYHNEKVDRVMRSNQITDTRTKDFAFKEHSSSDAGGFVNLDESDFDWYFKEDPVLQFTDDGDIVRPVSENLVDWGTYAANQRGNSVRYVKMDELEFDPGYTKVIPNQKADVDIDAIIREPEAPPRATPSGESRMKIPPIEREPIEFEGTYKTRADWAKEKLAQSEQFDDVGLPPEFTGTGRLANASSATKEKIASMLGGKPSDDWWDRSTLSWITDMLENDYHGRSTSEMKEYFRSKGLGYMVDWYDLMMTTGPREIEIGGGLRKTTESVFNFKSGPVSKPLNTLPIDPEIAQTHYDLQRRLEEQSDNLTWEHIQAVRQKGKAVLAEGLEQTKGLHQRIWDRLRVAFSGDQEVSPAVFNWLRGEAAKLEAFRTASRVSEVIDRDLTPTLGTALRAEQKSIWSLDPTATGVDKAALKGLTSSERTLFTRLNKISGGNARTARRLYTLVRSKDIESYASRREFIDSIRQNKEFTDLTDTQIGDLYDKAKSYTIEHRRSGSSQDLATYIYQKMEELNDTLILQELMVERARNSFPQGARQFKDAGVRTKWLLARMDGAFRKHLDPNLTPVSLTHNIRARQIEDFNPLMQVLSKHAGLWDEFVKADSPLAERIWLYIETKDQRILDAHPPTAGMVKEVAEVIEGINRMQGYNLKRYGAGLTVREGYTISLNHNASKLRDAGFENWANYVGVRLDWEATFDRLGVADTPEARSKEAMLGYLRDVYDDILEGRFRELDNPMDDWSANLAKETSQRRSMIFKEGALWEYDTQFGSGAPVHALFEQIMRRSDLTELMKTFGPRPQEAWAKIKQDMRLNSKDLSTMQLDKLFEYHTGQMDNPANRKLADLGQMSRIYASSVFLGNSGISAMNDTVHSMNALQYLGVPLGRLNKDYWNALSRAWARQGSPFQAQMRAQAAGGDALLGVISRKVNGELPGSAKIRNLNKLVFTLNGLNLWTTIAQEAMVDVLNRNMHLMIGTPHFDQVLARYGMTDYDLRVIKKAAREVEDIDGPDHPVMKVTPDMVLEKDPQTAQKYRVFLDDWMRQGILEPNATGQIFARFGLQAGTPLGEAVRTLTQYMAFGFAVQQKTYRRMLYGYGHQGFVGAFKDPDNRRVLNMMGFAAWSMAVGYATMNMKEILRGREPVHLGNMNDQNIRKWIFQSGVAGPLSDLLWARDSTDLGDIALGPFFGGATELAGELMEGDTQGFLYDLERNAPFANQPIIGEVRRQLFGIFLGQSLMEANQTTANLFDQRSLIGNNPE